MIKENQRRVIDRQTGAESVIVTNRNYPAPDLLWDYSQVPEADRAPLQAAARDIKRTARQSVQVIGAALDDAKARLQHGQWGDWLAVEFDWTDRTAQRIMAGAAAVGKNDKLSDLGASALYLTAAAPDDAQAEIGEMAANRNGSGPAGRVTVADVGRVVKRYTGGTDTPDTPSPSGGAGGRTRAPAPSGSGKAVYVGNGAASGQCSVCGRALSASGSVGRACGPTCAAKLAAGANGDGGTAAPVLSRDVVGVWLDPDVAERVANAADSGARALASLDAADVRVLAQALRSALGW